MAWLEITVHTAADSIDSAVTALTAGGFSDLVIEDQEEFESFLDQNREYWDYIDENLQKELQGLSRVKLYLEDTDAEGMAKLEALVKRIGLTMTTSLLPDVDYEESWKDSYPPQPIGEKLIVLPYWLSDLDTQGRSPVILDPGPPSVPPRMGTSWASMPTARIAALARSTTYITGSMHFFILK